MFLRKIQKRCQVKKTPFYARELEIHRTWAAREGGEIFQMKRLPKHSEVGCHHSHTVTTSYYDRLMTCIRHRHLHMTFCKNSLRIGLETYRPTGLFLRELKTIYSIVILGGGYYSSGDGGGTVHLGLGQDSGSLCLACLKSRFPWVMDWHI